MTAPVDRPYKPPGRAPLLTRAEADRLIYRYTTGTPVAVLAKEAGLDQTTVRAYIKGEHKHPALRVL
jgi:predicted transcriptional regulator